MDGNQVPQELVSEVGITFETILEEACFFSLNLPRYQFLLCFFSFSFIVGFFMSLYVSQTNKVREEFTEDMSIQRAISIVFERNHNLRYKYLLANLSNYFLSYETL